MATTPQRRGASFAIVPVLVLVTKHLFEQRCSFPTREKVLAIQYIDRTNKTGNIEKGKSRESF